MDWFYHFPNGSIDTLDAIHTQFENRFKMVENENAFISQLSSINKEVHESMRVFEEKLNKLANRFQNNVRPRESLLTRFFMNTLPPYASFHLKRECLVNLVIIQRVEIEIEDDLVTTGKWKNEVKTRKP